MESLVVPRVVCLLLEMVPQPCPARSKGTHRSVFPLLPLRVARFVDAVRCDGQPAAGPQSHRVADITELQQEQGGASTVKLTLIGRPGRVSNKGTFMLTTMQSSKVPALPKGLPVPAQASTTYAVYIAQKQWRKVEEALRNPEDILRPITDDRERRGIVGTSS